MNLLCQALTNLSNDDLKLAAQLRQNCHTNSVYCSSLDQDQRLRLPTLGTHQLSSEEEGETMPSQQLPSIHYVQDTCIPKNRIFPANKPYVSPESHSTLRFTAVSKKPNIPELAFPEQIQQLPDYQTYTTAVTRVNILSSTILHHLYNSFPQPQNGFLKIGSNIYVSHEHDDPKNYIRKTIFPAHKLETCIYQQIQLLLSLSQEEAAIVKLQILAGIKEDIILFNYFKNRPAPQQHLR